MRNQRHKRPVAQRRGRSLQDGSGVGHRDLVRQSKKCLLFTEVYYSQNVGTFSYGLANINISTTPAGIANNAYSTFLELQALTYEEYRIRRVTARAQPGNGFTNDDRIKASIFAKVDVNSQPTVVNLDTINSVICSEATVNRTFTERSNVKLVDYRPICFSTGGTGASSRPILPSQDQWYNIDERGAHLWRGATVAPVIPDNSIQPASLAVTVWVDIEIEFRGRRPDFASTASNVSFFPAPPCDYGHSEVDSEEDSPSLTRDSM
jgi:hypothetical protein